MKRILVATAVTLGALFATSTAASAAPFDDRDHYVSGYDGPGEVLMRSTNPGSDCQTRRALLVTNNLLVPDRLHRSGKAGSGWVCVTQAGYAANPVASWWDNTGPGPKRAFN